MLHLFCVVFLFTPPSFTVVLSSSTSKLLYFFVVCVVCFVTLFQFLTHITRLSYVLTNATTLWNVTHSRKHRYLSADSSPLTARTNKTYARWMFCKCTQHICTKTQTQTQTHAAHNRERESGTESARPRVRWDTNIYIHILTLSHASMSLAFKGMNAVVVVVFVVVVAVNVVVKKNVFTNTAATSVVIMWLHFGCTLVWV